jgi:tRNA 2-selenouridine synthase
MATLLVICNFIRNPADKERITLMMLSPELFFNWKDYRIVVDLRPSDAFIKGSFFNAMSIPAENFNSYSGLTTALKNLQGKTPVHLVDGRGEIVNHLIKDTNFYCLEGGYTSFKMWRENMFLKGPPIAVIGGKTGSGKTELLHALIKMGSQVIDLEALALHKGSVFGGMSCKQPTYENFQNKLLEVWLLLDKNKPVWMEEKGHILGKVGIPQTLLQKMNTSCLFELEVPFEKRLLHIKEEYNLMDKTVFANCIKKLEKRMGFSANHKALHCYATGQTDKCLQLLLDYYDKTYDDKRTHYKNKGIQKIDPTVFESKTAIQQLEACILAGQ